MFKEFFKKVFRSRKSISPEEAEMLEQQIKRLNEDVSVREAQVIRLGRLMNDDPVNLSRYAKRINIHSRIINDNKKKIEELEIKLLDK